MPRSSFVRFVAALAVLLPLLTVPAAARQAAPGEGLSLVASGLANPRGMTWDPAGGMYVALAGSGGDTPGVGEAMGAMATGNLGGPSAGVVKIVAGCGVPVAGGLPSYRSATGNYRGVAGVAFLGPDLYALVQGGGAARGNPEQDDGFYRIEPDGRATMVANLAEWMEANPVAEIPGDYDGQGDPFALISDGSSLLAVEANSGQILRFDGEEITRVADLSDAHPAPTGLARADDGSLYVGYLTEAPFRAGASRVDRVAPDGSVSTVWTGLTMVTGVASGPDGALYALEMATDHPADAPYGVPGSGRLVRQTGPDGAEEVLTGLDFPVGLAAGPDGALYVSFPGVGEAGLSGGVLRVDPTAPGPLRFDPSALRASACGAPPAATPVPAAPSAEEAIARVAGDLANPRGMTWDDAGTLYVAQSGTGDTAEAFGAAASVATILGGCPVEVAGGLPSTFDPFRDVLGPQDVAILDGHLYVLQGSTGALDEMPPDQPNGIYRVEAGGRLTLVADLTAWLNANPVANPPGDRNARGEPYRMLPDDGFFWVVDSNSGEVLHVTLDGGVRRFADTSAEHHVVTAFAPAPGGGVYLGTFTPSPHDDGKAKVIRVGPDGTLTDVWTGLTTVTGLVVAADGSLYAVEMATGNETGEGMRPNTGRLIRQTGPAAFEEVATGLNYPIDLGEGPDGGLYVSGPAYGGTNRDGWILRIDPAASGLAVDPALMADGNCPGDDATPVAGAEPTAAPPLPTPTPAPMAPAAPTEAPAAAPTVAPTGATAEVRIADFAFAPATLEIAAGTTVTWTNDDAAPHTATARDRSFDSGNLNPGESYSFTFSQPGTYDYVCSYHGGMRGTIVVS